MVKSKSSYIEIIDAGGRLVYAVQATTVNTFIDLRKFAKGLYHIHVKSDNAVFRQKVSIH
jgi:hypothetical protein